MKRKYLLIALVVLGVVLASFFVFRPQSEIPKKETIETPAKILATIAVDFDGEKASTSAKIEVGNGTSALALLEKKHEVQVKNYSFGDLVEGVDGVLGGNGRFWIYYVNGKAAKVGAGEFKLSEGDLILWKLEAEKK